VVTVAEALIAAWILFHVLIEQQLKERWPNSVFMYGIWRSWWSQKHRV